MNRALLLAAAATVALAGHASAQTPGSWYEETPVFATTGSYGLAVALHGDVAAIGAPADDPSPLTIGGVGLFGATSGTGPSDVPSGSGYVVVHRRGSVGWEPSQTLTLAAPAPGDGFGAAIALRDAVLIAGTPGRNEARVFVDAGAGFAPAATLTGDAALSASFGRALAYDGDTLVVASPSPQVGSTSGRAYLFARIDPSGAPWAPLATLSPSISVDSFADAVAVASDVVVVSGSQSSGEFIFIFHEAAAAPGTWSEAAFMLSPDPGPDQGFGAALATDGQRLYVGAPGDDDAGEDAGAVYVFARHPDPAATTPWSQVDKLYADDAAPFAAFGRALTLDAGRLFVSSAAGNLDVGFGPAVYVLEPDGAGGHAETGRLFFMSTAPPDHGGVLAASGDTALLAGGSFSGATFFARAPDPCDAAPCLNGACAIDGEGFSCTCDPGWVGDLCQHDDPCDPVNPCQNDGLCGADDDGQLVCDCRFAYPSSWGTLCENPVRCASCIVASAAPDDPDYDAQPGLTAMGWEAARTEATGANVRVAVVGFGVSAVHADFPANYRPDLSFDFLGGDADPTDGHPLGTAQVSLLAARTDNGLGFAGVAPDAEVVVVRVADPDLPADPAAVAAGVAHAHAVDAQIIVLNVRDLLDDPDVLAAILAAHDDDVLLIGHASGFPGRYPEVVAVGSFVVPDLEPGGGGAVDVGPNGPGTSDDHGGALSPPYDVLAPTADTAAQSGASGSLIAPADLGPAMVGGVAALVWSRSPSPSASSTRDRLLHTARDLGVSGWDPDTGHGLLRADVAVSQAMGCAFCRAGFDGCLSRPCDNGGACERQGDTSYTCACVDGYRGGLCQFDPATPCETDICDHGVCTQAGQFPSCTCEQGYYGAVCDQHDCLPNPCMNDGVCTSSGVGSFFCICQLGYGGTQCQNNLDDPCDPNPCVGGTCSVLFGDVPTCQCPPGSTLASDGVTCEDVDECATDNGGCEQLCTNDAPGYACGCTSGYDLATDGVSCDDVDECSTDNGGCDQHCTNLDGGRACTCDPGYALDPDGATCADIDDCPIDACDNGGTCVDELLGWRCDCGTDYKGATCGLAVGCGACSDDRTLSDDPLLGQQWALERIGAPWAWTTTTGSPTVQVAILSSGIDLGHPDLPRFYRPDLSYDVTGGGGLKDLGGLGTYVAGLVAGDWDDGVGIAGLAPRVEVAVYKITGPGGGTTSALVAEGILRALAGGARVLVVPIATGQDFPAVAAAVSTAVSAGAVVVAPAGGFPGLYDGVIAVGGVDRAGVVDAAFVAPDLVAPDGDVLGPWAGGGYEDAVVGAPTALTGAVAALAWSVAPSLTAADVRALLLASAEDLGDAGWDTVSGHGLLRADGAVGIAAGCVSCPLGPDPCATGPCKNGGRCERLDATSYLCDCPAGTDGADCADLIDPCAATPCANGGACTVTAALDIACSCPPGFGGPRCEVALGACTAAAPWPGCADQAVESCVCAMAPGCCTAKWAPTCVTLAANVCASASGPPPADDPLRACACAQKQGCCDGWAPICDEIVDARCRGAGECFSAHARPSCEDPAVSACVCDQQPLCCTFTWHEACASYASAKCRGADAGAPAFVPSKVTGGLCDQVHAGTGCLDGAVEGCVCSALPHCCVVGWDEACVKHAEQVCLAPPAPETPPATTPTPEPDDPEPADPPTYEGPKGARGPCCEANADAAGCDEAVTELCVCTVAPFCCEEAWDDRCALIARDVCGAFCTFEPPTVVLPVPGGSGPEPVVPVDLEPADPCFLVTQAMDVEACRSVAFSQLVEDARRLFEEQGIVVACVEERALACAPIMTEYADAQVALEVAAQAPVLDLVIRPFSDPADFPNARQRAVLAPDPPAPPGGPASGAFIDLFTIFSADAEVNSCEEFAFQMLYDYFQWQRIERSRFSQAYASYLVDAGGIGWRGVLSERVPRGITRTVRTLTEAQSGFSPVGTLPGMDPKLGDEFAADKNSFFGVNGEALEALARRDGILALNVYLGAGYWPARATTPWTWHRDRAAEIFAAGWTVTDLLYFDELGQRFRGLLADRRRQVTRRVRATTDAAAALHQATIDAIDDEIAEQLRFAQALGCLDIHDTSPCDWSPFAFIREVESFYQAHHESFLRRCYRITDNDFDNLSWLRVDPGTGDALQVLDLDPRQDELQFLRYLRDVEDALSWVLQATAGQDPRLVFADEAVNAYPFGNEYFGVTFGWDHGYHVPRPVLNTQTGACAFDATAHADFYVTGSLLTVSQDLLRAQLDADVMGRVGHASLSVLGDVHWSGGSATPSGSASLPLNLVVAPASAEDVAVKRDYFTYDEWIAPFWVPIHLYARITGQAGVDLSVRAWRDGFTPLATLEGGADSVCAADFEMGIRGRMTPYAELSAKASASIGVPGFEAGVGGELTLLRGSLPFILDLRARPRPGAPQGLENLQLVASASLHRELVAMSGTLYAYLEYVCGWDLDTCTRREDLFSWGGWRRTTELFRSSAVLDVGIVSAVCEAVAAIPHDVLSCGDEP